MQGETFDGLLSYFDKLDAYSQYLCKQVTAEEAERQHQILDEGEKPPTALFAESPHLQLLESGSMTDEQIAGVDHLMNMWEHCISGILVNDDAGSGKRLQCIAFICYMIEMKLIGPFIIACPHSKLQTWIDEFQRHAPKVKTIIFNGKKDEMLQKYQEMLKTVEYDNKLSAYPVVLSSFDMLMNCPFPLSAIDVTWKYVVVDTACNVLALNSRLLKELLAYTASCRLLLVSTPPRNNLTELWSLLHFIMPDSFSDAPIFKNQFNANGITFSDFIPETQKEKVFGILHSILSPFVVRSTMK